MELPEQYITEKFYQLARFVKHKRGANIYNAACNSCREGKSWGKKTRLFYIPEKNIIHCHRCGKTWRPIDWIMENSGMSYKEVMEDIEGSDILAPIRRTEEKIKHNTSSELPDDCINLFDKQQCEYYIRNSNEIVKTALTYIKSRRLYSAINKPKALYLTLTDHIHKNRLIIPFYDEKGNIIWYQSRTLLKSDEKYKPKYLSKYDSDKSIFGIDNINPSSDYIFVFEGPVDAMFVENGVAICGISLSETQNKQINRYIFHKKIWVMDNEANTNKEVKNNMETLIEKGETVFFWPEKFKNFKDVNQLCSYIKKDYISPSFFTENSYSGSMALAKLTQSKLF